MSEVKTFKVEDTSIAKVNRSKIKKLSNLIGKDSNILSEQDLISLKNMYDSDIKEIENLQNQISSEKKRCKRNWNWIVRRFSCNSYRASAKH